MCVYVCACVRVRVCACVCVRVCVCVYKPQTGKYICVKFGTRMFAINITDMSIAGCLYLVKEQQTSPNLCGSGNCSICLFSL